MKNLLRRLLRRVGVDVHRYHPNTSRHRAMQLMMRRLSIDLVFDVGANTGQFAQEVLDSEFAGRIVSFEPLSSAHSILLSKSEPIANWRVHPRAAIGDVNGVVEIKISENSVSSSLLPILNSHITSAPESKVIGTELVPLVRLDDVAFEYLRGARFVLLKIDTQGFEWQVLDGANGLLSHIAAVQLELSLVPLYDGQHSWREHIDRMDALGFQLYFTYPAFTDANTGQTLQWDATFVRRALLN